MKELLVYLIKNIVNQPEAVEVSEEKSPSGLLILHLSVAPADMGRVIGKEGKIIKAVRTVLQLKAYKENVRFSLDLRESS